MILLTACGEVQAIEETFALRDAPVQNRIGTPSFRRLLHHKILGARMMHHYRRRTLLGFQQEAGSQADAYVLFRLEQGEELGLVLQVRTGRIAEGIARAAILLMEEIANVRRVFGGYA